MESAERNAAASIPLALLAAAGLGWAGSRNGVSVGGVPLFALSIGLAFAMQWIAFVPAFAFRTERFYDLVGSITYIVVAAFTVALAGRIDARASLLLAMVCVWALRLGTFLFLRVLRSGRDERFTEIKRSSLRFLSAWTLQGLWVSFTLSATLAAIAASKTGRLGATAWIGVGVWLAGFGIEAVADEQKRRFRADLAHRGDFIRTGLWAWSRHPNYFGEIVLWIGAAIVAAPVFAGWQWVTMLSPLFVIVLLTRVSGVPILERRADEKWGEQEEYERYKRRTSVLVLRPPRRG